MPLNKTHGLLTKEWDSVRRRRFDPTSVDDASGCDDFRPSMDAMANGVCLSCRFGGPSYEKRTFRMLIRKMQDTDEFQSLWMRRTERFPRRSLDSFSLLQYIHNRNNIYELRTFGRILIPTSLHKFDEFWRHAICIFRYLIIRVVHSFSRKKKTEKNTKTYERSLSTPYTLNNIDTDTSWFLSSYFLPIQTMALHVTSTPTSQHRSCNNQLPVSSFEYIQDYPETSWPQVPSTANFPHHSSWKRCPNLIVIIFMLGSSKDTISSVFFWNLRRISSNFFLLNLQSWLYRSEYL